MYRDLFVHNYNTVWKPLGIGPAEPKHAESVGHYKGLTKQYNETSSLTITDIITIKNFDPSS